MSPAAPLDSFRGRQGRHGRSPKEPFVQRIHRWLTRLIPGALLALPALASAETPASPAEPSSFLSSLSLSGYLQTQYESHSDSEDQLDAQGGVLNQDRFLVRRARLRLDGDWGVAGAVLEVNGGTGPRGHFLDLYRAEGLLRYQPEGAPAPLVEGSLGLMKIPFGHELVQSSRRRPFMERSLVVRSLFPSTTDVGARVGGTLGAFHWTLAAMNGTQPGFLGQDPNENKDLLVRVGFDARASQRLRFSGNVSVLQGRGFSAGMPATKPRIEWRDLNEDGVVQPYEMAGVPGRAATPSRNFHRWAVGADAQIELTTALGATRLLGEVIVAQNLDRFLFQNDPEVTGLDARQFGFYAGLVQELGRHAFVGVRYDSYDPDSNVFDDRGGSLVPRSMRIESFSPVVGLVLPDRAQLSFQYDFVRDGLARDATGVPTDRANDGWTIRLQVEI